MLTPAKRGRPAGDNPPNTSIHLRCTRNPKPLRGIPNMHHIMTVELPKHGPARFLVEQTPEHCSLDGGRRWQTNALFPNYRKDPDPVRLPASYRAHLLAANTAPVDGETWNREILAGYVPYGYGQTGARDTTANPGTIKIRGRDTGELTAHLTANGWIDYRTNLSGSPSPGERKWLDAHLAPALKAYIDAHRATLYADAYAATLASIADALRSARAELDKLEEEARAQTSKLPKP